MRGDESKGQLPIDDWLDSHQKNYFGWRGKNFGCTTLEPIHRRLGRLTIMFPSQKETLSSVNNIANVRQIFIWVLVQAHQ
jgi:hypothetical protein